MSDDELARYKNLLLELRELVPKDDFAYYRTALARVHH